MILYTVEKYSKQHLTKKSTKKARFTQTVNRAFYCRKI